MAVKIRARGAAAAEEAPKPTRKPAARKASGAKATTRPTTRGKRAAAKPAAKAAAPKRAGRGGRPPKAEGEPTRRNRTSDIGATEEARMIKLVTKAGERRMKAEEEHKESVNALHAAAKEALDAGVSMAKVADASGISRQWLYKMGEFADRGTSLRAGGNGSSTKPAARAAVKRTPAKRTPAKTAGKATGAKTTPRTRIRARS